MIEINKKYEETECSCKCCIEMCMRPCWPLPEEAEKMIKAGLANKLWLDYWGDADDKIFIVGPAAVGYEGKDAPFWPIGKCTFLKEDLCEIHNSGFKPFEGRVSDCKKNLPDLHGDVAQTWNSEKGREVVELWKELVIK